MPPLAITVRISTPLPVPVRDLPALERLAYRAANAHNVDVATVTMEQQDTELVVSYEVPPQGTEPGDQSRPDGTSSHNFARIADQARRNCEKADRDGYVTWSHIARKEFWAAMAETDPVKLRAGLLQLGAVCAAWVCDIDARP